MMMMNVLHRTVQRLVHGGKRVGLTVLFGALVQLSPAVGMAQGNAYFEQSYLPGMHNYEFNDAFPAASRLFNAFDYGHAILYQALWQSPATAAQDLDGREYNFLTKSLLPHPPRVALDEAAVGPDWALLAPEVLSMFHWAHLLHRQLYDVLAHDVNNSAERNAEVATLVRYYKSRPMLAFSSSPKSMALMEGQPFSRAFRKQNPRFNGLIWSYHWYQMALYDALLKATNHEEQHANVDAVVGRFMQMAQGDVSGLPSLMPMSPAIAPLFSAQFTEASIIFDNLHSLHDVVSDILANPIVPRSQKRRAILQAAKEYRDVTTGVTTVDEWVAMAHGMGVDAMGGPVPPPNPQALQTMKRKPKS